MSKVSVIIPVYNVEAYLPKCIESVQNQTEKDIEIILVDDGSTDSCGEICEQYAKKDSRIKVIHQENAGQGIARNTGLFSALGEYVLFVDSDDWIDPDLIERTYCAAKSFDAQMVLFDIQALDAEGNFVYAIQPNLPINTAVSAKDDKSFLLVSPSPCNKLMQRSWLLENHFAFPNNVKMLYEDLVAFVCLNSAVERGVYLGGKPLYNYFLRPSSSMHNGNAQRTTEMRILAINKILDYYQKNNLLDSYQTELDWVVLYHGFFLPAREILNFTTDPFSYIDMLRENAISHCAEPKHNPYLKTLSTKEKLIYRLLYGRHYFLTKVFWKLNTFLKK